VDRLLSELEGAGANLTLCLPDGAKLCVGRDPERARVLLRSPESFQALKRRDLLRVAEAYLAAEIDVEGDFLEVMRITDVIQPGPTWSERLRLGIHLLFRNRRKLQAESISFHYDRPAEFFLPWFERWRSYSHGIYLQADEPAEHAQERKLERALRALSLEPGMHVLDMGCGWGSFLEYAGLRGVHVHGITISAEQHRFVSQLIREQGLPCSVELVDFLDYDPAQTMDAAVFMGTFEHFTDYRAAADRLKRHLGPEGRIWADFCSEREGHQVGSFLARYIWPGTARYVDVPALLDALIRAGFNVWELEDDTLSYGWTCRDWANELERSAPRLSSEFGEESVRAFLVFLRASEYFLGANRTQAYHLVAGKQAKRNAAEADF